jgi:hypothetical protein
MRVLLTVLFASSIFFGFPDQLFSKIGESAKESLRKYGPMWKPSDRTKEPISENYFEEYPDDVKKIVTLSGRYQNETALFSFYENKLQGIWIQTSMAKTEIADNEFRKIVEDLTGSKDFQECKEKYFNIQNYKITDGKTEAVLSKSQKQINGQIMHAANITVLAKEIKKRMENDRLDELVIKKDQVLNKLDAEIKKNQSFTNPQQNP